MRSDPTRTAIRNERKEKGMSRETEVPERTKWRVTESYIVTPTYNLSGKITGEHKVPTLLVSTDGKSNSGNGVCHVLEQVKRLENLISRAEGRSA